jgi:uncharacterized membrane protein YraQ (UPF0718 family)
LAGGGTSLEISGKKPIISKLFAVLAGILFPVKTFALQRKKRQHGFVPVPEGFMLDGPPLRI